MIKALTTIREAWTGDLLDLVFGIIGTAIGMAALLIVLILPMLAGGML
jgi:hypothetical protein